MIVSHRREHPTCPRCKLQLQLARVVPERDHELWVYRCVGCGAQTTVVLEPLA
jgi:uncharacterized Zn finger protein